MENPGRVGIGFGGEFNPLLRLAHALKYCGQIPHAFQQSMSTETTPILSRAIIFFEMFMTELEKLGSQHEILEPWTDTGLHWAKKYYARMDDTDVYIVTMCRSLNWYITALL